MATFTKSDDLRGAVFVDADLRGVRFVGADLSGVVMRGVDVAGTDIDAPWRLDGESFLRVNGVDVVSMDGEWSFAQALRHLIMATDTWLGRAIQELERLDAQEPLAPRIPGDHSLLPAHDPRGAVGAPPLRRTRPRRDRGGARLTPVLHRTTQLNGAAVLGLPAGPRAARRIWLDGSDARVDPTG